MSTKVLVCRCEDVTLGDVTHAVALGFTDIEEVKRYTGLGTGPCGGKECMALCTSVLVRETGRTPSGMQPFTARPPIATVMLGTLARGDEPEASTAPREPPAQARRRR
jgi:sarcosine oxidase subunit beta